MERKSIYLYCCILCLIQLALSGSIQAQSYNGFPPPVTTTDPPVGGTTGTAATTGKTPVAQQTASGPVNIPGGMNKYDPYLDNHLKSPDPKENMGLFGKPIKEVELLLKKYGAKSYSYAFGKYSRMTMAAYIVTMYFDRERRLGGFSVEPKPPYSLIGPDAKKFFQEFFLGNGDVSKFKMIVAGNRLEMRYSP